MGRVIFPRTLMALGFVYVVYYNTKYNPNVSAGFAITHNSHNLTHNLSTDSHFMNMGVTTNSHFVKELLTQNVVD